SRPTAGGAHARHPGAVPAAAATTGRRAGGERAGAGTRPLAAKGRGSGARRDRCRLMTADARLVEQVRRRLADTGQDPTAASVAAAVAAEQQVLGTQQVLAVVDLLRAETLGAGPLQPLLGVDGVTDVLVNGPDEVYLDRGKGLER